jgi:O-antigen/teichoic acid export membrane protein
MGRDFSKSYYIVLFLILPDFVTLTQEIAYTYLIVINELKYRAYMFVSASVLSIVISFLLAPELGSVGCAFGIFTATVQCHIIGMNLVNWKIIKLEIPHFIKECYLSMLLPILVIMLFGFGLSYFQSSISLIFFFIKIVLFIMMYISLLWLIVLREDEKILFKQTLLHLVIKIKR